MNRIALALFALAAAAVLSGCGSMLPPPRLSAAEQADVQSVGRIGSVAVDPGAQRPSTSLFERLLAAAILTGPSFTIRGGTIEILRSVAAKGLES